MKSIQLFYTIILLFMSQFSFAQPSNNDCSAPIWLNYTGSCNYKTYSNTNATKSGTATSTCGTAPNTDIWFRFVMPKSGDIIIQTNYINFRGAMALYKGSCSALTEYKCDDNTGPQYLMPYIEIQDSSSAGDTLYLQYWGDNSTTGDFEMCIFEPTRPKNRTCENAVTLTVQNTCNNIKSTTLYAGHSGVPKPSCGNYVNNEAWFEVKVPKSGRLVITTENNGIGDAVIALYKGKCDSLKSYLCDMYSGIYYLQPEIYILDSSMADEILKIRIFKENSPFGGDFGICAFEPQVDSNETCEKATVVVPSKNCNYLKYTNWYHKSKRRVTPTCGSYVGSDAWFKTIVPQSGQLVISTRNVNLGDLNISIYTGNCDTLTQYICETGNGPYYIQPEVVIDDSTLAGDTIYILAFKQSSVHGGEFEMCIFEPSIPKYKSCMSAEEIVVQPDCNFIRYTNQYAQTSGDGNPSCEAYVGTDIWLKFMAPESGEFTINTKPVSFSDMGMSLYTGSCGSLSEYICSANGSEYGLYMPKIEVKDTSIGGQIMYIQLWRRGDVNGGSFDVCVFGKLVPIIRGAKDYEICANEPIPVLSVKKEVFQYYWYDQSTGGNLLASDTNRYLPTTAGTYWVEALNSVTQQRSKRTGIKFIINPLPTVLNADDVILCADDSLLPLKVKDLGAIYNWYENDSLNKPRALDTNQFLPPKPGKFYLQAIDRKTGCKGAVEELEYIINPVPLVVNPYGKDICDTDSQSVLSVNNMGSKFLYTWYSDSLQSIILAYDTVMLTVNKTGAYWVQSEDQTTGCLSKMQKIKFRIGITPEIISPLSYIACNNMNYMGLSVKNEGHQYRWYSDAMGLTIVQSDSFRFSAAKTGKYYVRAINKIDKCSSKLTEVEYKLHKLPLIQNPQGFETCNPSNSDNLKLDDLGAEYSWYSDSIAGKLILLNSPILKPSQSGTYYVEAIDKITGCKSEKREALDYKINIPPKLVNPKAYVSCDTIGFKGLSVEDLGAQYSWFSDSIAGIQYAFNRSVYRPVKNGIYYVEAEDLLTGCKSLKRESVEYKITLPLKPLIAKSKDSLHTSDASSYQWYRDQIAVFGENRKSILSNISGNYFVKIVDSNGCESASDTVNINIPTTNISNLKNLPVSVYPNPVSEKLYIQFGKINNPVKYTLLDLTGKSVLKGEFINLNNVLDLSGQAKGVYQLVFNNEDGSRNLRLIIGAN